MIVLIALAAICLALIAYLRGKDPVRRGGAESGPFTWRGGRRQITEDEAVRLVVERLRERE